MFCLIFLIGMCMPCWNADVPSCVEDSQCMEDYYCVVDAYFCRQCLRCQDFMRAPPPSTTECVKSVVECGGCLEEKNNDYECGSKTNLNNKFGISQSKEIRLPVYAWILLVLIFVVIIIGGIVLFPLINKVTYISVSRSENRMPQVAGVNDNLECAWSSPPAYNTVVNLPSQNVEEPAPYVKPIVTAHADEAREAADRQATRPYSPPNYIRGPQLSLISAPDPLAIHNNNTGMQNSVDGVISVRSSHTPSDDETGTVSNIAMEECPNGLSSTFPGTGTEVTATAAPDRVPPLVVFNNNVHLQSVSLSGASIFLPQSPNSVERR